MDPYTVVMSRIKPCNLFNNLHLPNYSCYLSIILTGFILHLPNSSCYFLILLYNLYKDCKEKFYLYLILTDINDHQLKSSYNTRRVISAWLKCSTKEECGSLK